MHHAVTIEHLSVGVLGCACTIVADVAAGEAIVVDGGDEVERIVARLDALGVRATHLVHTHAHIDHIGALAELRERTGGLGLLHAADRPLYAGLREQARWLGIPEPKLVELDGDLADGDIVRAGVASLEVMHTPGHTHGSVSFALETGAGQLLLTGDTLFRGSVGRTDLGGTTLEELVRSIRTKLFSYSDDTVVIPGHGPSTTIGREKRENPFAGANASY
jgi:glyoxylase-like metal-dependent hydrolase (beta-lactamase superfamily II)